MNSRQIGGEINSSGLENAKWGTDVPAYGNCLGTRLKCHCLLADILALCSVSVARHILHCNITKGHFGTAKSVPVAICMLLLGISVVTVEGTSVFWEFNMRGISNSNLSHEVLQWRGTYELNGTVWRRIGKPVSIHWKYNVHAFSFRGKYDSLIGLYRVGGPS